MSAVAYVLMTAMPPTKGHQALIQYASTLAPTRVIVCTQPGEPMTQERYRAIKAIAPDNTIVFHFDETVEQNPEAEGFWKMWADIYRQFGFGDGDYIVASEPYGKRLAQELNGKFMPYDLDREILKTKGGHVRHDAERFFSTILPEFQHNLRQKVTFLGAESIGKTTLSKKVAMVKNGWWTFEWARPYLESLDDKTITVPVMLDIWKGQKALEEHVENNLQDRPWVFQDTDLFATLGYWGFWQPETIPAGLIEDAVARKSDLYIIPQSNIPFEPDDIRYGGGKRESSDQYWIDLCEQYNLNYVVLEADGLTDRLTEVYAILNEHWKVNVADRLAYERQYNDA